MADLTDAQQKRAEARERRRKQSDAGDDANDGDAEQSHQGVRQAAKVAAVAGAAGAAAAAARALTSHNEPDEEHAEPKGEAEDGLPQREEPQEDERQQEDNEQEQEPEQEPEQEQEQEQEEEPVAGANPSDARRVIDRGREQLQELIERPVESVSSLERTHNGWVLALEVVELNRVPESTDVLASYEMELDENLDLRRYQQVRRYHRGRTDRGDDS